MKAFSYVRPTTPGALAEALAASKGALLKAAGIDVLDRMKARVDEPDTVVGLIDVEGLDTIEVTEGGGIEIGSRVTLAALANSAAMQRFLPSLAEAAGLAASPQLRHRATLGGNLGQHTRCGYYRHQSFPCLKRGGDHCPVLKPGGVQDEAGIFGNGVCASAHPSSLAPVLGSLDVLLQVRAGAETAQIPFAELWDTPRAGKASDLTLGPTAFIERILVPPRDVAQRHGYAEVRQKAAFDWALATAAVRLEVEGGTVRQARIWVGSLAPVPLRRSAAEALLIGKPWSEALVKAAGEAAVKGATPLPGTTHKVQLAKVVVRRALQQAWERA